MISTIIQSRIRDDRAIKEILLRTPILTYHKIDSQKEIGINTLPPKKFQQQMRLLFEEGFQPITFYDLFTKPEMPEKPVIITFDDAYESVYQNAFPVMEMFNFRAVLFVITGFMGQWNTWDVNPGGIRFRHLSERQLKTLAEKDWEIGAHTITHRGLPYLNRQALWQELYFSRRRLENITRKPVISLAYPFGLCSNRVCRMAKKSGYQFGCKSIRGNRKSDFRQLSRIPVYRFESLTAFKKKLTLRKLPLIEKLKLSALSWPANLTPVYQFLFRRQLFLENNVQENVYFTAGKKKSPINNLIFHQEDQGNGK